MGFIDDIKARAKSSKKTIVLPETEDKRTYEAAEVILAEGLANLILVGNKDEIEKPATLGSWYHGVGYYCFEIKVSSEAQSENAPAKYGIKSDKDNFIKAQSGNKSINNSF